jgi:hypothetical protein
MYCKPKNITKIAKESDVVPVRAVCVATAFAIATAPPVPGDRGKKVFSILEETYTCCLPQHWIEARAREKDAKHTIANEAEVHNNNFVPERILLSKQPWCKTQHSPSRTRYVLELP